MPGVVLVVGSYNQDHAWTSDELPAPGATRLGTYASGPGGKGFNQAVAASRAGARTGFLTALGDDAAAATARALAAEEGIELLAEVHAALPSGTAGIFVDAAGRNVITVAPGANAALSADYVRAARPAFAGAGVVLAQLEVAPDAVHEALALARDTGATTVLNPAPANAPTTAELLALADILTPNETEFAALLARHAGQSVDADTLASSEDDALHALCQSVQATTWVITLGGQGAFVSHAAPGRHGDEASFYRVPAHPAQVVDTTGAGDAFSGALAAALAGNDAGSFAEAVGFASRYAALSTEAAGAALSMPRLRAR
ncbi:ribokinase [Arenimonas sp.]|uniref:ribokinase n=1 Tax=Arenimonas sp. TaxID=1872635 RepID=UPI0035B3502F